jgi:hypothetical protein
MRRACALAAILPPATLRESHLHLPVSFQLRAPSRRGHLELWTFPHHRRGLQSEDFKVYHNTEVYKSPERVGAL